MKRPAERDTSAESDGGLAERPDSARLLDPSSLPGYLRSCGVAPDGPEIIVTALSGGISNVVLRADWSGGGVVVKQSLPRLRVEADWEFDRARASSSSARA